MKKIKNFLQISLLLVIFSLTKANAATITSAATGNWSDGATWVGGSVPVSTDNVVIATGHTVTLDISPTVINLTVNSTATLDLTTYTLSISGAFTNTGTFTAGTGTVNYNGASQVINAVNYYNLTINGSGTATINGATTVSRTMTVTSATTNNSTLTVTTALSGTGTLTQGANSILNIGGTSLITGLDLNTNANTVNYTGTTQIIKDVSYNNLDISGAGVKTWTQDNIRTVGGTLTVHNGST